VKVGNGNKNVLVLKFLVAYPLLQHQDPKGKKISREQKWKGEKGIVAGKRLEINNSWDIYGRGFTIKGKQRDMRRKR
jgi:hypothetical protein